jgi:uncharacterized protein YjiS (DUF1127 family)
MSLINLFVAARNAMARRRQRRRAMDELMALDDRSLADIGIHRSQISGVVEGMYTARPLGSVPRGVAAAAFGQGAPSLAGGRPWLPPI